LVGSVLLIFVCLWCPIMCLYILSSVLWCPHKTDVQFVFTSNCLSEDSCLIYIICAFLSIVVSTFFFILCTLCCQIHWIVHFFPFGILQCLVIGGEYLEKPIDLS
jgi:hypothetical protein